MIYILTGKSGSGKDTMCRKLIENGYENIVSYTSRNMRDGEKNGKEYWFVNKDDFINMINNNEMLEYRSYNTLFNGVEDIWYYGVKKQEIDVNKNYVVILDFNGAKSFIEYYGKDMCKVIYIEVSDCERERRARLRGSFDETEWNRRLIKDNIDFSDKSIVDMIVYN